MAFEGGFAVINPGAGWPSKIWPAERYAAVARHLSERWQLPTLVVWAGQTERALAERLVEQAGGAARVGPASSLPELAALARRAGFSSRPIPARCTWRRPWARPAWACLVRGPLRDTARTGGQHVALQKMFFEGPDRARRTAPAIYMESISTEMVCEACDRILQRGEGRARNCRVRETHHV